MKRNLAGHKIFPHKRKAQCFACLAISCPHSVFGARMRAFFDLERGTVSSKPVSYFRFGTSLISDKHKISDRKLVFSVTVLLILFIIID